MDTREVAVVAHRRARCDQVVMDAGEQSRQLCCADVKVAPLWNPAALFGRVGQFVAFDDRDRAV
jgi:hypothetical protein